MTWETKPCRQPQGVEGHVLKLKCLCHCWQAAGDLCGWGLGPEREEVARGGEGGAVAEETGLDVICRLWLWLSACACYPRPPSIAPEQGSSTPGGASCLVRCDPRRYMTAWSSVWITSREPVRPNLPRWLHKGRENEETVAMIRADNKKKLEVILKEVI